MSRFSVNPRDYGFELSSDDFMDLMVDEFSSYFRGGISLDELLLHPKEALGFCDEVRRKNNSSLLPDDIILRSIMIRRKNPK